MKIQCNICGSKQEITPAHKDYSSVKKNSKYPYICEFCARKIQFELQGANDIYKPTSFPKISC
ncbi:hypothetical protein Desaci_2884 [Desulfosporosinus acidiphilus SJ4]|uniref:DUF2197 domain-containing protein n=1 Tax=Desulfosporosinus acidiphilus (strain DSM 22704 / JCM 16185 / SJ4) TaxID=646529 RepID=I4D7M2_DESAJ|nr:hypothetical protein [Desulfosporosinus acidiphilus]AFM41796.1 hypothetical protein Desaci_2884 [Desulfosporosinus acidiphilus SJ4]